MGIKVAPLSQATALAIRVLPYPGEPCSRIQIHNPPEILELTYDNFFVSQAQPCSGYGPGNAPQLNDDVSELSSYSQG